MLPDNYKQLREELNDFLIELDIPKIYWYQLDKLNIYLNHYEYNSMSIKDKEAIKRATELVHEISPVKLTKLNV